MVSVISLGQLQEENKVTANKMAEQVQQVMTKAPKKVEAGEKLTNYKRRKREQIKTEKSESKNNLTYHGAGAVIAVGVLGVISYYVYWAKTRKDQTKEYFQFTDPLKLQTINLIWIRL